MRIATLTEQLETTLKTDLGWRKLSAASIERAFLRKCKWEPNGVYKHRESIIVVEYIQSDTFSRNIYETEIPKILKINPHVCVCFISLNPQNISALADFCALNKWGLKQYLSGQLEIICQLPFEKELSTKEVAVSPAGSPDRKWFPSVLIKRVRKISRLSFKDILIACVNELEQTGDEVRQQIILTRAIEKLFNSDPRFVGEGNSLVKLSHFENLLEASGSKKSEHVFHSFRVFLVGCVILDKSYRHFLNAYRAIMPGVDKYNIEYVWLLTALFHDIGYVREKAHLIMGIDEPDENFLKAMSTQLNRNWLKPEYQQAKENIVVLLSKLTSRKKIKTPFSGTWEIGQKGFSYNTKAETLLITQYNRNERHSVVSCFEMVASILRHVRAIDDAFGRKIKAFVNNHLYLAGLSICYHDWHLWPDFKKLGIFPLQFERYPFASLLIYIDTWDDFHRGANREIIIGDIRCKANGCEVVITWPDNNQYLAERKKYGEFKKNVKFTKFRLSVKITNEKT